MPVPHANRSAKEIRPRPPVLRALGADDPPAEIEAAGHFYCRSEILKHDSWAATAIYDGPAGRIVCKFNRRQSVFGLPMRWLGRALARREGRFLKLLEDLPNVPNSCGPIRAQGKRLENAVGHAYVPGHPLGQKERVNDDFFPRLDRLLSEMHRRKMAYVDLHKAENIIVGEDGQPYLIDFQICMALSHRWPDTTEVAGWLLNLLQRSDNYCFRKRLCKCRPDLYALMAPGQKKDVRKDAPWWILLHRLIGKPFRAVRRRLLTAAGVRDGHGRAASEQFAEDAVRRAQTSKAA